MARKARNPQRQPVQDRSRQTVGFILEAAVQVFEAHGLAGGTTARIAERAGVSVGSLYQYFPDKQAVLNALGEAHVADAGARIADLLARIGTAAPDLPALLRAVVETALDLHADNPVLHRLLYEEGLLTPDLRARVEAMAADLVAVVAALLDRQPEVRPGDRRLMAWFVVQTVEHFAHRLVIRPPAADIGAAGAGELVHLLHRYLTG
ncbi:TetR/AcrR family transcriptional regulator [Zavarzinia compransoris]|uniref:TetR/AcrR family transcriptional regulator n=1 Tax=Zavarzinia compransoris TaxID=1264899 RepID=UPI0010600A28|nr:TetR/AcrR family transcriptional regulator [Zavarzinia compransoris]TDP43887.1 TetR family transcriptional regulator [Zavarzinia compransoris]